MSDILTLTLKNDYLFKLLLGSEENQQPRRERRGMLFS